MRKISIKRLLMDVLVFLAVPLLAYLISGPFSESEEDDAIVKTEVSVGTLPSNSEQADKQKSRKVMEYNSIPMAIEVI